MTAIALHIAESKSTLPMWHLCAVRSCPSFVAGPGLRCDFCRIRERRESMMWAKAVAKAIVREMGKIRDARP